MPSAQYFREQAEALRRHARASRRRRRLPPNWIIGRLREAMHPRKDAGLLVRGYGSVHTRPGAVIA